MNTRTFMNIKGQGNSLTFVQGQSGSTFSNFSCSETARPVEAKFHMACPDMGATLCMGHKHAISVK